VMLLHRAVGRALASFLFHVRLPPGSPPFPYTTLFRSVPPPGGAATGEGGPQVTTPEEFETTVALTRQAFLDHGLEEAWNRVIAVDRKSTRLNSSHVKISYAVFCLKKKTDARHTYAIAS